MSMLNEVKKFLQLVALEINKELLSLCNPKNLLIFNSLIQKSLLLFKLQ